MSFRCLCYPNENGVVSLQFHTSLGEELLRHEFKVVSDL